MSDSCTDLIKYGIKRFPNKINGIYLVDLYKKDIPDVLPTFDSAYVSKNHKFTIYYYGKSKLITHHDYDDALTIEINDKNFYFDNFAYIGMTYDNLIKKYPCLSLLKHRNGYYRKDVEADESITIYTNSSKTLVIFLNKSCIVGMEIMDDLT